MQFSFAGSFGPPLQTPRLDGPSTSSSQSILNERLSHQCSQCGYSTDRRNNLQRHLRAMHTPSGVQECCGQFFQTKVDLRRHTKALHRRGFPCSLCGHQFPRRAQLRRHFSVHTGIKPFKCSLCVYVTNNKSNLERHSKVHTKQQQQQQPVASSSSGSPSTSETSILSGLLTTSRKETAPLVRPSPLPSYHPRSFFLPTTSTAPPYRHEMLPLLPPPIFYPRPIFPTEPRKTMPQTFHRHTIESILSGATPTSTAPSSEPASSTEPSSSSSEDTQYVPKKLRMAKKYVS